MPTMKAKVTNFETGEERIVTTGYPGLLMAVTTKVPAISSMNGALCMAYVALHPEAVKLKGPELLEKTVEFFLKWDYEELVDPEEDAEVPLEGGTPA